MSELLPSRVHVVGEASPVGTAGSSECEGSCAPSARGGRGEDVLNLSIMGVFEGVRWRARMAETLR